MKIRRLLAIVTVSLALTGGAVGVWNAAPEVSFIADSNNVLTPDAG